MSFKTVSGGGPEAPGPLPWRPDGPPCCQKQKHEPFHSFHPFAKNQRRYYNKFLQKCKVPYIIVRFGQNIIFVHKNGRRPPGFRGDSLKSKPFRRGMHTAQFIYKKQQPPKHPSRAVVVKFNVWCFAAVWPVRQNPPDSVPRRAPVRRDWPPQDKQPPVRG